VTRDQIYETVTQKMVELFDLDPAAIKPESRFEDLELTSIDAIDLIIELQQLTGRKVNEAGLRSVRTVNDLVTAVHAHLASGGEPPRTPPSP
jgi:acyl carrier protein